MMEDAINALEESCTIRWVSVMDLSTGNANRQRKIRWVRLTRRIGFGRITIDQMTPIARSDLAIEQESVRANTFGSPTKDTLEVPLAHSGMGQVDITIGSASGTVNRAGCSTLLGLSVVMASRIAMFQVSTSLEAGDVLVARTRTGRQDQLVKTGSQAGLLLESVR